MIMIIIIIIIIIIVMTKEKKNWRKYCHRGEENVSFLCNLWLYGCVKNVTFIVVYETIVNDETKTYT